jgi:hypothetical protein
VLVAGHEEVTGVGVLGSPIRALGQWTERHSVDIGGSKSKAVDNAGYSAA